MVGSGKRVSVIIATYNSGERFDDVVASLDAQTMPPEDHEVIVVDDGSPDEGFVATLQELVRARPHWRMHRIENSGWPGRPRNEGVRLSVGDYVFYLDHDDHLFPEALQRMADFADEHGCDVLHPKEVVRGWKRPLWPSWPRDIGRVEQWDQELLQCITPHKLYRRSFLLEHQIAFPEGRVRLEDFDYNAQAWSQTERIGVLASYPCYRWELHQGNSHKSARDDEVYWESFVRSLRPMTEHLREGDKRDHLLVRWYRSRVLQRLRVGFAQARAEQQTAVLERLRGFLPHFPPQLDRLLDPVDRSRSALLRAGDREGLAELATLDSRLGLGQQVSTVEWGEGRLLLSSTATVEVAPGEPLRLERRDGALYRRLPASLQAGAAGQIEVGADVAGLRATVLVRNRSEVVDRSVPTTSSVELVEDGDALVLRLHASAEVDPQQLVGAAGWVDDVWDVYLRWTGAQWTPMAWFAYPEAPARPALVQGRAVIAYPTRTGNLAIDLGQQMRHVLDGASVRWEAQQTGRDWMRLPLTGPHTATGTAAPVAVTVHLDRVEVPGALEPDQDGLWLRIEQGFGSVSAASVLQVSALGATSPALTVDRSRP